MKYTFYCSTIFFPLSLSHVSDSLVLFTLKDYANCFLGEQKKLMTNAKKVACYKTWFDTDLPRESFRGHRAFEPIAATPSFTRPSSPPPLPPGRQKNIRTEREKK